MLFTAHACQHQHLSSLLASAYREADLSDAGLPLPGCSLPGPQKLLKLLDEPNVHAMVGLSMLLSDDAS